MAARLAILFRGASAGLQDDVASTGGRAHKDVRPQLLRLAPARAYRNRRQV